MTTRSLLARLAVFRGLQSCRISSQETTRHGRQARERLVRATHAVGIGSSVESLESRRLLSAAVSSDPAFPGRFTVTFREDLAGTQDQLTLRASAGRLEYRLNAADFTSDLDTAAPGVQSLALTDLSRVDVQLGAGNDTLTFDFSGGEVIPSAAGVRFDGAIGVDSVVMTRDVDFVLTNAMLTLSSGATPVGRVALTGVERAALVGGNSSNRIDASAFTAGDVLLDGQGQNDTLLGGSGADTLVGTQGSDLIDGRGGNDSLYSGNSGSTVYGGAGNDTLYGDNGKDFLFGQAGDDLLIGSNGSDELQGGDGNDTLDGGNGDDLMAGQAGYDTVRASGNVSFTLTNTSLSGLGKDTLSGFEAAVLTGGTGNNTIDASAFSGDAVIDGGGGTDNLIGGAGTNVFNNNQGGQTRIVSGPASNTFNLTPSGYVSLVDGGGLDDINFSTAETGITIDLKLSSGTAQNVDGRGFLVALTGTFENVVGTSFSDAVIGNAANNIIYGGTGKDTLDGGAGDDLLFGGTASSASTSGGATGSDIDASNDILYGGLGADTIDGGNGNDLLFGGTASSATTTSGATGSDIDASNDILYGGLGLDTLDGGAGDDLLFGGTASSASTTSGATGSDIDASNDILYGGLGVDTIDGGNGDDLLFGGTASSASTTGGATGSDIDASNDILFGGPGTDTLDGGNGNDLLFGGTTLSPTSTEGDLISGNDILFGGSGNDTLNGGGGNDRLIGNLGDDLYLFGGAGLGQDIIDEAADDGTDTLDFSALDSAVTIDLALTSAQSVSSQGLSLTLTSASGVENVIGSRYADTVYGNLLNNRLLGAAPFDDRYTTPPASSAVVQWVFLDFDSGQSLLLAEDHVYSQAERDAIQARMAAVYAGFRVDFTQVRPATGAYATVVFNGPPVVNGTPQPGGIADDLDFRNLNLGGTALVDVNLFLGGPGQPAATSENFVAFSATVGAHELGHLLGLRHLDSAGPIGFGLPPAVRGSRLLPTFTGPRGAFETNLHLMTSPASVGSSLFDAVAGPFLGEREAIKLAFNEGGTVVPEQSAAHATRTAAQPLSLASLAVPNTIRSGLNYGKDFAVAATTVVGSIGLVDGVSEDDYYSFTGRAGDLINLQLYSGSLTRNPDPIDSILRLFDASGNLVTYFDSAAVNDDELEGRDSVLLDLRLPSDGTYVVQIDTFADASLGVPDTDTGNYELLVYRFDTGNASDGNDLLDGRGGNDSITGGLGDDTLAGGVGTNLLVGGAGLDLVVDTGDVNFTLTDTSLLGTGSNVLTGVERASLTGGVGANTFRIDGWTGSALLDGGAGADTLIGANVLSVWTLSAPGAGNVNGTVAFSGFEALLGGSAADTLRASDVANTWSLTALNAGSVNTLAFSGMENLVGGSANDSISLASGAGVAGTLSGGAGINTLDYSAYLTGITVNLTSGVATGAAGISGFTHVLGGAGNDSLTGDASANVLVGNAGNDSLLGNNGRDLLIGGLGADLLDGGNDDDLLIGARTSYDANLAALTFILAEWSRTDAAYALRRDRINGVTAPGLNGVYVLNATTVFDDNKATDTFWGGSGTDWFIFGLKDDLKDKATVETSTRV